MVLWLSREASITLSHWSEVSMNTTTGTAEKAQAVSPSALVGRACHGRGMLSWSNAYR